MIESWRTPGFDNLEFVRSHQVTHGLPTHTHDTYSIGIALHGVQRLVFAEQTLLAGPGTVLLSSPGQVVAHAPLPGSGWAHKMLHVSPDFLRHLQRQGYIPRRQPLTFGSPLRSDAAWVARYDALHQQQTPPSEQALGALLGALFAPAVVGGGAPDPRFQGAVADVQAYLQGHQQQKLALDGLASRFALDKYQLVRQFRQHVGMTPNGYLTMLRVEQAKRLLAQGCSLVETALEAGFYDQSHFSRYFLRYTGFTPGDFQRAQYFTRPGAAPVGTFVHH